MDWLFALVMVSVYMGMSTFVYYHLHPFRFKVLDILLFTLFGWIVIPLFFIVMLAVLTIEAFR